MKWMWIVFALLLAFQLPAQTETQRQKHFNLEAGNLAIQGYDPVSYFNSSKPLKGKKEFRLEHGGVSYLFANAANLQAFRRQPDRYEPAWGGWCGHAMALRGEKVAINPTCYKIINGRNVLFYKTVWANALDNWNKELKNTPEGRLMEQGDAFWKDTFRPE